MPNSVAFMVIAIVAIVTFGRIYSARHGLRPTRHGYEPPAVTDNREAELLRDEVKALKERIIVLERIATETNDAVRIDQEIARLRDR